MVVRAGGSLRKRSGSSADDQVLDIICEFFFDMEIENDKQRKAMELLAGRVMNALRFLGERWGSLGVKNMRILEASVVMMLSEEHWGFPAAWAGDMGVVRTDGIERRTQQARDNLTKILV